MATSSLLYEAFLLQEHNQNVTVCVFRLWYVHDYSMRNSLDLPVEVGYMNVIPKCLDSSGKYPVYENLPETYAAINAYLSESPLEGKVRPYASK